MKDINAEAWNARFTVEEGVSDEKRIAISEACMAELKMRPFHSTKHSLFMYIASSL